MQPEIVKIKLGDEQGEEQYAYVYIKKRHKTERLVQQATAKFLKVRDKIPITVSEKAGELSAKPTMQPGADGQKENILALIDIDMENADFTAANDILILSSVQSWSFGKDEQNPKGVIDQGHLDEMPEETYDTLLKEVNKLYGKAPLAVSSASSTPKESS